MLASEASALILIFSRFTLHPMIQNNTWHVATVGYWFQLYVDVPVYYHVFFSSFPQLGQQAGPPLVQSWAGWWWMFWIYSFWCFLLVIGVPAPVFFDFESHPFAFGVVASGCLKLLWGLAVCLWMIVPAVKSTQLQLYCCQRFGFDPDFVLGPMMFFVVFTFFQSTAYILYDYLSGGPG